MSKKPTQEFIDALQPSWEKRYKRLLRGFGQLQAAAQKVVDETDHIHNGDPWPIKYRAPYGAIAELRSLLLKNYGLRGEQDGKGRI